MHKVAHLSPKGKLLRVWKSSEKNSFRCLCGGRIDIPSSQSSQEIEVVLGVCCKCLKEYDIFEFEMNSEDVFVLMFRQGGKVQ